MSTELTFGTKFYDQELPNIIYRIIKVTPTRVVFTDGKIHSWGASNKKQSSCWLGLKRFEEHIATGKKIIVE